MVNKGYEELQERDHKRVRRRSRSRRSPQQSHSDSCHSDRPGNVGAAAPVPRIRSEKNDEVIDVQQKRHAASRVSSPTACASPPYPFGEQLLDLQHGDYRHQDRSDSKIYRRDPVTRRLRAVYDTKPVFRKTVLMPGYARNAEPDDLDQQIISRLSLLRNAPESDQLYDGVKLADVSERKEATPEELLTLRKRAKDDVDLFMSTYPHPEKSAAHVAKRLLKAVTPIGALDDVRSLCLWILSAGRLDEADLEAALKASQRLFDGAAVSDTTDFFVNLLLTPSVIQLMSQSEKAPVLHLLTLAIKSLPDEDPSQLARTLLVPFGYQKNQKLLVQDLNRTCKSLLAESDAQSAAEIILAIDDEFDIGGTGAEVAVAVFSAALENGSLSTAARLFRTILLPQMAYDAEKLLERLVKTCFDLQAYAMIVDIHNKSNQESSPFRSAASADTNHMLCVAYAHTGADLPTLSVFLQALPRYARHRTLVACNPVWPDMLRSMWRRTRNLDIVQQWFRKFTDWKCQMEPLKKWKTTPVAALNAMMEISIDAGRRDLAKSYLQDLQQDSRTNEKTIAIVMRAASWKNDWDTVRVLLSMAKENEKLASKLSGTDFNNVLVAYSQHHNATEVWKFTSEAIDQYKIVPDQATSHIMLQAFVSKQTLSLIPRWIRYMNVNGFQISINVRTAAALVKRYWIDHRPSHVLLMWLCRNLQQLMGALVDKELLSFLRDAIAYDLRKMKGQNAELSSGFARLRLEELEKARAEVPSPGHRWNEHLIVDGLRMNRGEDSSSSEHGKTSIPEDGLDATSSAPEHAVGGGHHSSSSALGTTFVLGSAPQNLTTRPAFGEDHTAVSNDPPAMVVKKSGSNDKAAEGEDFPRTPADTNRDIAQDSLLSPHENLANLRSLYEVPIGVDEDVVTDAFRPRGRAYQLEREMILDMSQGHNDEALQKFTKQAGPSGLPVSVLSLEIAIEASLCLNKGQNIHAAKLVETARRAGMDVTGAMGPLLLHQMYHLTPADKKDLDGLRAKVLDYYRSNEANGLPVKHFIGVTAADILIDNHRPRQGINLLDAIYRSEWAIDTPPDIVAMTVFLKGFSSLKSLDSIRWVIKTVLEQDIRIDHKFMVTLKDCREHFKHVHGKDVPGDRNWATRRLDDWRLVCRSKREQQMSEAKKFGNKLVECLARCAKAGPTIDVDKRLELEDLALGARVVHNASATTRHEKGMQTDGDIKGDRIHLSASSGANSTTAEKSQHRPGHHSNYRPVTRTSSAKWTKDYRALLRMRLLMPDKKLAAHRYVLWQDECDRARTHLARRRQRVATRRRKRSTSARQLGVKDESGKPELATNDRASRSGHAWGLEPVRDFGDSTAELERRYWEGG